MKPEMYAYDLVSGELIDIVDKIIRIYIGKNNYIDIDRVDGIVHVKAMGGRLGIVCQSGNAAYLKVIEFGKE